MPAKLTTRRMPLKCSSAAKEPSTFELSAGFTRPLFSSRVCALSKSIPLAVLRKELHRTNNTAVIFATGVLTIPSSMYVLGALPGAINVIGWQLLNTYCAIVQGNFRNSHAGCHSIADMAEVVGGKWMREIVGIVFLVTFAIVGASGVFGSSVALNALSDHSICTNYFMLVATFIVFLLASVRKFEKIAWLTWVGFISVFVAVFVVV